MEATSVTSKGRVTIPKEVRQQLGIRQGSRIEFSLVGDHVEMRVKSSPPNSGFGMLKSRRAAVPADFDLAMLYNAANLVKKGLLKDPPHVQFVMGIPNAMPARRSIFDFLRSELKAILPNATWVAAGVARFQWEVNQWCLETGGHVRTGLEDNLKITPDRLAASNAELVKKVADGCERFGRRPATPAEARKILGLRAAA